MATLIPNPDNTPGAASTGYGYQNTQIYAMRVGHIMLGLTNIDNTSASQIAAGSVVEVNGAFFKCSANENITGTPVALQKNYIYAVVEQVQAFFQYSANEPTWNPAKGGWYYNNARAVARVFYMNSLYYDKIVLDTYSAGASASTSQPIPDPSGTPLAWYGLGAPTGQTAAKIYELNLEPGGYSVDMCGAKGGTGGYGGAGGNGASGGAPGVVSNPIALRPYPKFVVTEKTSLTIVVGADGSVGRTGRAGFSSRSVVYAETTYNSGAGAGGGGGSGSDGGNTCLYGPITAIAPGTAGSAGGQGGTGTVASGRSKIPTGGLGGQQRQGVPNGESGERGVDGEDGESINASYYSYDGGNGGKGGQGGLYNGNTTTAYAYVKIYKAW